MLNYLIPGASKVRFHPVYQLELRRRRKWRGLERVGRISSRMPLLIIGLLVAGWGLVYLAEPSDVMLGSNRPTTLYANLLLIASVLMTLPLDFSTLTSAASSIAREYGSSYWDLLQTTNVPQHEIIAVKHTLVQAGNWRTLMLVTALRLSVIAIGMLIWMFAPSFPYASTPMERFLDQSLLQMLSEIILLSLAVFLFLADPFWRVRTFTAVGLSISSYTQRTTSAVLTAVGAMLGLWLAQLALLYLVYVVNVQFWAERLYIGPFSSTVPIIAIISVILVIYSFYWLVRFVALRSATHNAFRHE